MGRSGSYVDSNGKVVLSKQREGYLARIKDKKIRDEVRKSFETEVQDKHDARQAYLDGRNTFGLEIMDSGMLRVKGTGGRYAHFTRDGAEALIENFDEFKKSVKKLPAVASGNDAEDSE